MDRSDLALALAVAATWGLNFSFIKLGVAHVDPFALAGLRFLLCALPVAGWLPRPAVAGRWLAAYGLAFGVGTWGAMTLAIQAGLSPALGAWLLQASAFGTPLLAWAWLGLRPTRTQFAGIAIAAAGFGWIVWLTPGRAPGAGVALALLAAACLSLANVIVRRAGATASVSFVAWSSLFAPLPLFALAWVHGGPLALLALPRQFADPVAVASLLFQVVPVTLVGYTAWNRLIARHGPAAVAPIGLAVPVSASIFAALILDRRPDGAQALGMAVIGLGLLASTGLRIPARKLNPPRRP